MKFSSFFFPLLILAMASQALADWPQWRGPQRNGTASDTAELPEQLPEGYELVKRWESKEIPSDRYGGHGSVAIAEGRLYLSVVWHLDEPTDTRKIDSDVLGTLGYRGLSSIPEATQEKMETDRMNLSRRLRGTALDDWAKAWVEENLDKKTQLSLGSWVVSRFKKGQAAIPLSVFATLKTVSSKTFANQAEMEAWVNEQGFEPTIREQIIKAVPNTKKVANDVILCIDAETGDELWRFEEPGAPTGRGSSSTPAIYEGKVYAAMSEHLYCVDAKEGNELWRAPLTGKKGPASSPLANDGKIYLLQNRLSIFDATSGELVAENKEVRGSNSSPAVWGDVILCNSQKELYGLDAETGLTLWKQPGGGDGTPVVSGNTVVITSKQEGKNLVAYELSESGAKELWSLGFLARRYGSSPVIHDGNVFHLGSERHLCIDLKTGETRWERQAQSSISSPILADEKLLVYENRGGFASLIDTNPVEYSSLGRAKVGALYCASPALVGKDLYLRTAKSVTCYRFE